MANLILLNGRAVDTNLSIVTDATAYFFSAGSTTPLTVYTDSGLGTPRGSSVAADSDGILPQCWTDQIDVKVDVRDGSGNPLPGFPQDNFPTLPETGSAGTDITMTPVTGNGGTNAQDFGANNAERLNTFDNAASLPVATGSGGSFAIATPYTITAYAARQEFEFVANHASVGGGSDSINVDGVGAVTLKKYAGSTSKADVAAGDIGAGDAVRVKYDGVNFVVVSVGRLRISASNIATDTLVTESDGISSNDNDTSFPTTAAVIDYAGNGLIDIWAKIDGSAQTIDAGNGVASVTRTATGTFDLVWDTAFSNADYACIITVLSADNNTIHTGKVIAKSTTGVTIRTLAENTVFDPLDISIMAKGS